jgi:hypothetical protein
VHPTKCMIGHDFWIASMRWMLQSYQPRLLRYHIVLARMEEEPPVRVDPSSVTMIE